MFSKDIILFSLYIYYNYSCPANRIIKTVVNKNTIDALLNQAEVNNSKKRKRKALFSVFQNPLCKAFSARRLQDGGEARSASCHVPFYPIDLKVHKFIKPQLAMSFEPFKKNRLKNLSKARLQISLGNTMFAY